MLMEFDLAFLWFLQATRTPQGADGNSGIEVITKLINIDLRVSIARDTDNKKVCPDSRQKCDARCWII